MLINYIRSYKKVLKPYGGKLGYGCGYDRNMYIEENLCTGYTGCVVATSAGAVGWSMCGPLDKFSKERAKKIAESRARKAEKALAEGKIESYYADNPFPKSIEGACYKMMSRSFNYYK